MTNVTPLIVLQPPAFSDPNGGDVLELSVSRPDSSRAQLPSSSLRRLSSLISLRWQRLPARTVLFLNATRSLTIHLHLHSHRSVCQRIQYDDCVFLLTWTAKAITCDTSHSYMCCYTFNVCVFLLRVWLHGLQLEQKGSTVSRAPKPRSRVYITFSGAAEKRLCDCGSGAVICGWCIVHNPGDFFARWLYCLLRVSGFKRPKFEADLSYITDNVSKCVRKCISKPRSCGFDL